MEDVSQDLVCETEEREDCCVDDLSLSTLVDFAGDEDPPPAEEEEEVPAVVEEEEVLFAHPNGIEELFGLLVTGRLG